MPYQSFAVYPANGNDVAHLWGMTTHSPQMVNIDNCEINREQALQTSASVIVETLNDNEDEYKGTTFHFRLPLRATQPIVQNLNQGVQIPHPHPGASFVVAPLFVHPGAPFAPYQNQYG